MKIDLSVFDSSRTRELQGITLTEVAKTFITTEDRNIKESCVAEIIVRMAPVIRNAAYNYTKVESDAILSGSMTALLYALEKYDIESNKRFEMFYKGALHSTYMRLLKETTYQKNQAMSEYLSVDEMKTEHGMEFGDMDSFQEMLNYDRLAGAPYTEKMNKEELEMYIMYLDGKINSVQSYVEANKETTYNKAYKIFTGMRSKIDKNWIRTLEN